MLKWVAWRVILDYLKFDERKESDDSDLPYQWPYARVAATWASSNYDRMIEMFLPFNLYLFVVRRSCDLRLFFPSPAWVGA